MYKGHGAVVIGSETSGGIRDITASNCVSKGTDTGIRIKSMRGRGGVLENFRFDNWVIEDAQKQAFEITMRYARTPDAPVSEKTPLFRNFSYSNITIINAHQITSLEGLPERSVEQLRFTDINATGDIGFIADHASDVELHHVRIAAKTGNALEFTSSSNVVLDDVNPRSAPDKAGIALVDSTNVSVRNSRASANTGTFVKIAGAQSAGVVLAGNDLTLAAKGVEVDAAVTPGAVTQR
jgi:polygalacturonase